MSTTLTSQVYWHQSQVNQQNRANLNGHRGCTIWLTGLSGSGKSTIANALDQRLYEMGTHNYVLDGDNVRHGLNKDLGFSEADRRENIRRIGEVSKLMVDAGLIVMTAFISPYQSDRQLVRQLLDEEAFIEVYVQCPLSECEKRDPKGLYRKARKGEIQQFTGISAPYEAPVNPEIVIETDKVSVAEAVEQIVTYLNNQEILRTEGKV
ncbi:adenylyl-sulfate kinase [Caldalkalibacillus salinus]|uniref:adenylyl-sulfate kinase n=1 Tax=Caldalkalibacillus salinus TaxID=2803787 RepID=UPI00192188C5|nr:adenylyl-sulfate kinase [Caldalkalibacillus salinus]